MKKNLSLVVLTLLWVVIVAHGQSFSPKKLRESTITSLHEAMQHGSLTATRLVQLYLAGLRPTTNRGRLSMP